jgi:hypothetical protein
MKSQSIKNSQNPFHSRRSFISGITKAGIGAAMVGQQGRLEASGLMGQPFHKDFPTGIFARLRASNYEANGGVVDLRPYSFLAGAVQLCRWEQIEPHKGSFPYLHHYQNILDYLQPRNMSLMLSVSAPEPEWLGEDPNLEETSWWDADATPPRYRPVPWDGYAQERLKILMQTLARLPVINRANGKSVNLCDHPCFVGIKVYAPVGLARVRNPNRGPRIEDLPGYTRTKFLNAVMRALDIHYWQWQIGEGHAGLRTEIFEVTDQSQSPPLWEAVRDSILGVYNGIGRPFVALGQDNCASSRPSLGALPVTHYPGINVGFTLDNWPGASAFEPLAEWTNQLNSKVRFSEPADCLACNFDRWDGRCMNLYIADTDNVSYRNRMQAWADFYRGTGPQPNIPTYVIQGA